MPEQMGFKINLNKDYTITIELGGYEKLQVLSELKKSFHTMCKMQKWLDDAQTPIKEREKYLPMFSELMQSVSYMWGLLKRAGTTDKEIQETLEIPF